MVTNLVPLERVLSSALMPRFWDVKLERFNFHDSSSVGGHDH